MYSGGIHTINNHNPTTSLGLPQKFHLLGESVKALGLLALSFFKCRGDVQLQKEFDKEITKIHKDDPNLDFHTKAGYVFSDYIADPINDYVISPVQTTWKVAGYTGTQGLLALGGILALLFLYRSRAKVVVNNVQPPQPVTVYLVKNSDGNLEFVNTACGTSLPRRDEEPRIRLADLPD